MKNNSFIKANSLLLKVKELNALDKLIISLVVSYSSDNKFCFMSQNNIANSLGVSRASISKRLKVIIDKGYINKINIKNTQNIALIPTEKLETLINEAFSCTNILKVVNDNGLIAYDKNNRIIAKQLFEQNKTYPEERYKPDAYKY